MKQNRSLFIIALSAMAFLTSSLSAQPVASTHVEESEVNPYMACSCVDDVDHPLFPEARPHLVSVGADFLAAQLPRIMKHKDRWIYMPGARIAYDYLRPDSIYFGVNAEAGWFPEYAHHKVVEKPMMAQVRLGYNLSYVGDYGYALVSPYVGLGLASSKVRFDKVAHLRVSYVTFGLRSRYAICSNWSIGCDAQAVRTITMHECVLRKVEETSSSSSSNSNSAKRSKRSKKMDKKKLYNRWTGEVALPVTYYMGCEKEWSLECAPVVTGMTLSTIHPAYGARVTLGYRF